MIRCKIEERECTKNYNCKECIIWASRMLNFETLKNPEKDGKYLCVVHFYNNEQETIIRHADFYNGEWYANSIWKIVGWKEIES